MRCITVGDGTSALVLTDLNLRLLQFSGIRDRSIDHIAKALDCLPENLCLVIDIQTDDVRILETEKACGPACIEHGVARHGRIVIHRVLTGTLDDRSDGDVADLVR